MKKITIHIIVFMLVGTLSTFGQSVRKPWSELTTSEKSAYINAIKDLSSSDVDNLADEHDRLFFDGIHDADEFLPWHRIFITFFEELVQAEDPDVTLPYWDWYEETSWDDTHELFEDASSGSMGLFGYTIIEAGSPWNYTRTFPSIFSNWNPNESDPDLSETSVTDFSDDIEGEDNDEPHNYGHAFVGGTMNSRPSPGDPIFYLHHSMVDKVWGDWFRQHPTTNGSGLNTSMRTFQGYPGFPNTIDATEYVDPRDMKIWYAYDHVLLLDKYTASGSESYYYSTGEIHVEDFTIPDGVDVELSTNGDNIKIISNFEAELGSELVIGN